MSYLTKFYCRGGIGKVFFPGNGIKPDFKYSTLYYLHFICRSLIMLSVTEDTNSRYKKIKHIIFLKKLQSCGLQKTSKMKGVLGVLVNC